MFRPGFEGGALLTLPIVPLVDSGDSAFRAADVVEHRFGHFEAHAKPLQARRDGSTNVMQGPPLGMLPLQNIIERPAKPGERSAVSARPIPRISHGWKQLQALGINRYGFDQSQCFR